MRHDRLAVALEPCHRFQCVFGERPWRKSRVRMHTAFASMTERDVSMAAVGRAVTAGHTAGVELMEWIRAEHAATGPRFEQSVVERVPLEHWRDPVGAGGSSLAWLAFHAASHEDIAVNAVLRGAPALREQWRNDLGLIGVDPADGLGETEIPAVTAALDLDAVVAYARAVPEATATWLATVGTDELGTHADGAAGLRSAGVDEAAAPWLYRMWADQSAAWFVQWEAIGHRVNHLGEMVSVRNRLGLSPF